MEIKWKTLLIILISIIFGITIGFWIDIPNTITFDLTDNTLVALEELEDIIEIQADYLEEECPIRLMECEALFEYISCSVG